MKIDALLHVEARHLCPHEGENDDVQRPLELHLPRQRSRYGARFARQIHRRSRSAMGRICLERLQKIPHGWLAGGDRPIEQTSPLSPRRHDCMNDGGNASADSTCLSSHMAEMPCFSLPASRSVMCSGPEVSARFLRIPRNSSLAAVMRMERRSLGRTPRPLATIDIYCQSGLLAN